MTTRIFVWSNVITSANCRLGPKIHERLPLAIRPIKILAGPSVTPTSVLLPYLACEGCRSTAITTQTKATNVTMALAACEYSHWIRNLFQLLGTTVQLLVA